MVDNMQHYSSSVSLDGRPTKKVPKSILQPKPKYNLKPALVSPEKREASTQEESFPSSYVETIKKGFGENADIFADVLKVSRDASSRDVRIAYFRRGREILAEGGFRTLDQAATVSDVSTNVRTRFQAVSMAYEIVSCTRWKKFYIQHGLVSMDDNASVDSADPVLGSAVSLPGSRPAVRWNGQVEELLFEKEPDEHVPIIKNPKKKKKRRQRVVVESESLDKHLEKLDNEAKQHFVADFWDSLEESLDGLLRMAVSDDKKKKKRDERSDSPRLKSRNSFDSNNSSVKSDDTSVKSDDRSVKSDDTPFDEEPIPMPNMVVPDTIVKPTPSKPVPRTENRVSPFRPISPDVEETDNHEETFDLDSISFSVDGPSLVVHVSPDSKSEQRKSPQLLRRERIARQEKEKRDPDGWVEENSSKDDLEERPRTIIRETVNGQPTTALDEDKGEAEAEDEDDVFEGLDDDDFSKTPSGSPRHIALLRLRSESPATASISELTGTVASATLKTSDDMPEDEVPDDEVPDDENVFDIDRDDEFLEEEDVAEKMAQKCESMLETGRLVVTMNCSKAKKTLGDDEDSEESKEDPNESKKEDGFVDYLVAYISAIVHDCAGKISELSEIDWDDTVLGAFMVNDSDMNNMLCTLEKEIQRTPSMSAVDVIASPSYEAIEAVRSFG